VAEDVPPRAPFKWWIPLLILFAPIVVPSYLVYVFIVGTIAIALMLYFRVTARLRARRLVRRLRSFNRVVSWQEVEAALKSGRGTLLIDNLSLGWNDFDVWWTPECVADAAAAAGVRLPAEDYSDFQDRLENPVFERWAVATYFNPLRDHLRLVQSTCSYGDGERLKAQLKILTATSGERSVIRMNSGMVRARGG